MAAPSARAGEDYDYLIKLLLIGDSGVGKSFAFFTVLRWFLHNQFSHHHWVFQNVKFSYRTMKFLSTFANYCGPMGILLDYDVTDESSFDNIRNWIGNIEQHALDNINKILVGNKADMDESKRAVPPSKGKALADKYGIKIFKTSAKINLNVEQVFFSMAKDIKQRLAGADSKAEHSTIKLL